MTEWIMTSWLAAAMVVAGGLGMYVTVIALSRIFGLRSFSKMSGFDFAITIATGSILAAVFIAKDPIIALMIRSILTIFATPLVFALWWLVIGLISKNGY